MGLRPYTEEDYAREREEARFKARMDGNSRIEETRRSRDEALRDEAQARFVAAQVALESTHEVVQASQEVVSACKALVRTQTIGMIYLLEARLKSSETPLEVLRNLSEPELDERFAKLDAEFQIEIRRHASAAP